MSALRVPTHTEYLAMPCRVCGEHHVQLVMDLGEQPNCNRLVKPDFPHGAEPKYPLRLGYCTDCTTLQIDHTIPRDDMFRDYVYVSGTTDTLRKHFERTTARLRTAYGVQRHDLVVDIGSNDGTWLKTWGAGQSVLGIEPSNVGEQARAAGVPTWDLYFNLDAAKAIHAQRGEAALITSAGSFFHMEDLHGAVEGVKHLLAPDGVFVVQAISGDDMIQGNAFDQVLHEHLLYYTVDSFTALMQRHGLEVFHVKHLPIHGGTNEYHVGHPGAHPIGEIFDDSVTFGDCEDFARRVSRLGAVLIAVLADYKSQGKSVWAYGAPGKGGTLLNTFGIGPDLVQFATEKNPIKFGLEIPGCRIPIVPEGAPDQPDAYLVLAWNFLTEFLAKDAAYLRAGGKFIVPVPSVRVLGAEVLEAVA